MAASHPNMPAADPQTSYSFYPYPLGSITSTSLSGIAPSAQSQQSQAGPSRDRRAEIKHADKVRHRAELRALAGLRPAGFALGRDSEDLEVEETALDEERQHTNMFGHRFLLPFGRRQTQMELDAARSATPDDPDNERRQEDRLIGDPPTPLVGGEQGGQLAPAIEGNTEEELVVDLDGDVEDLDEQGDEGPEDDSTDG